MLSRKQTLKFRFKALCPLFIYNKFIEYWKGNIYLMRTTRDSKQRLMGPLLPSMPYSDFIIIKNLLYQLSLKDYIFLNEATLSIWCVIGNKSNPTILTNEYLFSNKTLESLASVEGLQET